MARRTRTSGTAASAGSGCTGAPGSWPSTPASAARRRAGRSGTSPRRTAARAGLGLPARSGTGEGSGLAAGAVRGWGIATSAAAGSLTSGTDVAAMPTAASPGSVTGAGAPGARSPSPAPPRPASPRPASPRPGPGMSASRTVASQTAASRTVANQTAGLDGRVTRALEVTAAGSGQTTAPRSAAPAVLACGLASPGPGGRESLAQWNGRRLHDQWPRYRLPHRPTARGQPCGRPPAVVRPDVLRSGAHPPRAARSERPVDDVRHQSPSPSCQRVLGVDKSRVERGNDNNT